MNLYGFAGGDPVNYSDPFGLCDFGKDCWKAFTNWLHRDGPLDTKKILHDAAMIAGAPGPVAPFRHAIEADVWAFVSGRMPFNGTSIDTRYPGGVQAQTLQVMKNLATVLKAAGLDSTSGVGTLFLTRFDEDYESMNAVYASYFPAGRRLARTCIGVTGLAKGARVEIDTVARRQVEDPTSRMRE